MVDNSTKEVGPGGVNWERIETLTKTSNTLHASQRESDIVHEQDVGLYSGFWYLIDDNGNAISNGYHEIRIPTDVVEVGACDGYIGNQRKRITANSKRRM